MSNSSRWKVIVLMCTILGMHFSINAQENSAIDPQTAWSANAIVDYFYQLRLTPKDCRNISTLIKKLADLSLWDLLKKSREMRKLGKAIEAVHPLRFLGCIYSNPELKKRMPKIRNSHFKWKEFMEGLCNRLSKEARQENLHRFVPGFCQAVGVQTFVVEDFVRQQNWHGLVDYLMQI